MDYDQLTQLVILLDKFWEWANLKPWDGGQVLHIQGLVSDKAEEVLRKVQVTNECGTVARIGTSAKAGSERGCDGIHICSRARSSLRRCLQPCKEV